MKQTSSALTFLLAQYRAIFKRAYVKGIASAVLLTAGLAAGQAQADPYTDLDSINTATGGDVITIDGTAATGADTVAIEVKDDDKTLNKDVIFNLGNDSEFSITASGTGTTVAMDGKDHDITINGNTAGSGSFTFGAEDADAKLQIKNLGTLTIQNNAKVTVTAGSGNAVAGVDVYADTIKIDNSTVDILQHVSGDKSQNAILRGKTITVTGSDAVINLGSLDSGRANGGRATLGWRSEATLDSNNNPTSNNAGSNITFSDGATLNLIGRSGSDANSYNTQGSQVWGDSLTADKSFVEVSGAGAQIWTHTNKFTDTSFHVANKAQLVIKPFEFRVMKDGKTDSDHGFSFINGTTTFDGGNLIVEGNLQTAGTVVINDNVNLTAGDAALNTASGNGNELYNGVLTVGLGSDFTGENDKAIETESVLKISSSKLNKFLTASTTQTKFDNAQGVEQTYADKAGILSFGAGKVTLAFTDTTQVDLTDFNWVETDMSQSGSSAEAGAIVYDTSLAGSGSQSYSGAAAGVTVSGTNLLVSEALDEGAKKINLAATNLTLGSNSAVSPAASLGFKEATARNLTVLASGGDFVLNDTVTLRSVDGTDNVVASDGAIQGDLAIASGKTFTVDGGIYQTNDDFTVNAGGNLAVTNTKDANQSSLDLNRGINFNLSSSGEAKVSVDGGLTGEYQAGNETYGKLTQLDLRDGITATGTTGTAKITATSGGVVLVDDNDLNKIFAAAGSADNALSKVSFEISSDAALKAEGNVQMSFTDANATTLNGMLTLGSGGIFEADGLSITSSFSSDSGAKSGLGFTAATIRVDSLSITNNNSGASDAFLTGGTFEISNSLTVGNTLPLTLAASDVVAGEGDVTLKFDTGSNTATGTISAEDITNASANGKIIVAQGAWTATRTDFNLSSGTMTVGEVEVGSQDTASLTAYELSVSGSGSFKVAASVGSATFDHLDAWSTDGVNVAGTLTINGDDVTVDTDENPVAVHTNANSINVASTGTLTFGEDAVYNSIFGGTSGAEVLLKDSFAKDTIKLEANGNVSLAFNDTTSLSAEQVVDLKKKLFNNDTDGSILGFINLGGAKIENLEFGTDANGTPTITWDKLQPVADVIGAGTGNDELAAAKVTGLDSTDQFKSPVGSVVSTDGSVTVAGNSSFNNAAGNNGLFVSDTTGKVGNATVVNGSDVHLNGTGEIGTVSLSSTADNSSVLVTSNGSTNAPAKVTIASISGDDTSTFSSRAAETAVTGDVDVGSMETLADTVTTVGGDITVANKADFAGTTDIKGNAEFAGAVDFSGITTFGGNVEITGDANVTGNTTATAGNTSLSCNMTIAEGAAFTANNISLEATGKTLFVGTDSYTDENGEEQPGTTGYLDVANLSLNGNMLVVDPDYGEATSIAAIDDFDAAGYADDISAIHGTVVVGQNAALMVGADASKQAMSDFIERYQNGVSLDKDNVGAVVYLTSAQTVTDTSRIIIDPTRSSNAILGTGTTTGEIDQTNADSDYYGQDKAGAYHAADLYLGKNSVFAIDEGAMTANGAVHFDKDSAYIKGETGSKVVLVGDSFLNSRTITLFTDNGTAGETNGVYVMDNDIRVESLNGLMYFTLNHGEETSGKELQLDTTKVDSAFTGASSPMRDFLLSYATRTVNYDEHYSDPANVERVYLLDDADKSLATASDTGALTLTDKATQLGLTEDDFVVRNVGTKDKPEYVAYCLANNQFLEKVVRDTDGAAADEAARMGAFGGAAQAALMAASTTTDAIAGRMGMGLTNAAFTASNNGQGAGLWLTPIYKNSDSDGFEADGLSYGADIDLYGVSLGGDYTLANGLRIGAMFNVGSGEADGQGDASNVTNDFDYYGFGLYAGYSMGAFSIVGDVSYSVVDSDVDASTQVEKVSTSFDTAALSVGVTAQYSLDLNGFAVVPHAGLRYTSLDMDDYDLDGADSGNIGNFDADTAGIFSIPVGVTVAKEFTSESWTVKPALDITLTGNFGDDTLDGEINWGGVSNRNVATESEIVDNFTYSAALGVAAQTGNFSLGFGVNYTGSSNVDEFGVNANARFVF